MGYLILILLFFIYIVSAILSKKGWNHYYKYDFYNIRNNLDSKIGDFFFTYIPILNTISACMSLFCKNQLETKEEYEARCEKRKRWDELINKYDLNKEK